MKIDADIVGREVADEQRVDKRWLAAYNAALGELSDAPHPLFPVCYEWPATRLLRERAGLLPIDARLVHAQHDLILHRAPKEERLSVNGRVVAVAQRKPGVLVVYRFETKDAKGAPVSTTDFSALYRDAELEGGDRRVAEVEDPPPHAGGLPSTGTVSVEATAAHVYTECARIWNPIHTDREYARAAGLPDIILHGTATLAYSISVVLGKFGLSRIKRVRCRFSGMVLMPGTLTVHASRRLSQLGDAIAFETRDAAGAPVIERGWVE